jgi:hypothetical protein
MCFKRVFSLFFVCAEAGLTLFKNGFQTSDLQRLFSKGDLVVHNKGDIILREGAVNRNLYFIKSGTLNFMKSPI